MKVQRCQRQQALWDQTRSVCLVNCVGPAHMYFGISGWLVQTPMISSSICSPSPSGSGTSLAPFRKCWVRGTPAFLREIADHLRIVLHPLCSLLWLLAPDVEVQTSTIRELSSRVQVYTGTTKLFGSLSLWPLKHYYQQLVLASLVG
jgi:hypothetical protein